MRRKLLGESGKAPVRAGTEGRVHARNSRSLTLDTAGLKSALADAPREYTPAARDTPLVVSLPAPDGSFDRFALQESAIMAPGLARRHPGIKTYSGRGITDLSATIQADLTPLGFRASVRSANGNWYIDPYHVSRSPSVYASYFVRSAENTGHANNDNVLESAGLPVKVPEIPATGDSLRTYRTALISDPGYSTYHGGPQNVTAAKVALMNRVNHIYEDDLTIRLQLIANNDLLNLDTYAQAVAPNGPCGTAGCFTQAQVLGCSDRPPPHRDRPDHRREQLRPRPPRARAARRRCRQARRRRPREQGRRLHGSPDSDRRLLRRRLRRPRDGPPVLRQPHVRRQPAQLLGR